MSLQIIDVGSIANDNTGEPLRNAFVKVNENFSELFSQVTGTGANLVIVGNALEASNVNGDVELRPNGSGIIKLGNVLVNDYVISCSPIGTLVLDTTTNIKTLDVTNGFVSASTSNLGSLSNVTITGGTAGYAIVTDGAGTLSWAAVPTVSGGSGAATRLAYFATTGANISDTGPNLTWNGANLFTVTGNISTGNLIAGNLTLGADKIVSANSIITIDPSGEGVTGTVIIEGNLQVTGTTTTVNSSTVEIADLNITLAKNAASAAAANGAGLTVAGANATINYASTGDKWTFNKHIDVTGAIIGSTTLSITGNANVGNLGTAGLITATGNVSGGNLTTIGNLSVTGNANVGNIGATNANITAITATGNANVGNLGTAGLIIATGNITGGNLNSVNLLSANNASITSNISAGNINNVSGILSVTGNANVGNLGAAHGAFTGNIRAGNINSVSGILSVTGNANLGNLGAGAGIFTGVVTVTGNITGGNISTGGVFNSTGNANVGNLGATAGVFTGNITAGNINSVTGILSVTGNANVGNIGAGAAVLAGPLSGVTTISASGNANVGNIGAGAAVLAGPLSGVTTISASGNANVGNIGAAAGVFTNSVTITGNVSAGNISTTGILSVTGNANVGNIGAGAAVLAGPLSGATTINASGNANVGNLGAARGVFTTVVGNLETASQPNITVVGTLTGLTVSGNIIGQANLLVTSNITAGNINSVSGILSVTGNANVGNIGAGAAVLAGPLSGATTINASGNANVGNLGATAGVFTGNVNITGNTSAGNITATGILSVTGSANTGNLGVAGFIIATGNITGANVTSNGNVNTSNLSVTSLTNLGNVGNIRITGGVADYVLRTDGAGNLSWVAAGVISGSVSTGTGTRLAYYATNGQTISDTGSNLTWNGSNLLTVTGNISAGNLAGNITTAAQPLITSVGSLTSLTVTGNASAGNLTSVGNLSVTGNANVGNLGATLIVGSIATNAQPNITSVGNLIALNVGLTNITASTDSTSTTSGALVVAGGVGIGGNLHVGAANRAHIITGNITINGNVNNVSGILSVTGNANVGNIGATRGVFTNISGTLETAAQTNITSLGTLTSLTVSGNANVGNLGTAGLITASGNVSGGNVTTTGIINATGNVNGGNLNVTHGIHTGNVTAGNINSVSGILSVTGNANVGNLGTVGNITASYFIGNGSLLSGVLIGTPSSIVNGNSNVVVFNNGNVTTSVTGTANVLVVTSTGANIAGTLTATGNITGGNIIAGNLILGSDALTSTHHTITIDPSTSGVGGNVIVQGNLQVTGITTTVNSTTVEVSDLNITLAKDAATAAAANGAGLTVAGASATMTYASTGDKWTFNKPVDVTGSLTASTTLSVTGNANVGNIGASRGVFTNIVGTLETAAQTNITSVGTLSALTVSGNLTVDTNTLFVDSVNNKVGIGSITPAGLLGINGITFIGNQDSTGTTGTIRILGTGGATYIQSGQNTTSGSAADLIFTSMNASTEWVRFKSDGTVGIGTASPAVKFEVSGNNIRLSGNSTDVNFQLYNSASGAENWLIGNGQGSGAGTGLYFYNATDSQTRMLITNTGNVGIGNTAPTHALRVEGTFSASGSANVGNLGTAGLISATGNITGGNITTTGTVKGTKLVGGEFSTDGANLDLGIYASEFKVLEVFGSVNPNNSGSVDYTDIVHCYVYHGVGWNGSAVTSYIYVQHISPPSRSQYNSGSGLTHNLIDAVWLSSSNVESDSCSVNSATHQVRLKCTYSGTLSSFAVSVIKRM